MMKKILIPAILLLLACSAFKLLNTTVTRSSISFKIKNLGISTGGTIGGLQAEVHFNPADVAGSSLEASVDAATINTDNAKRDEHLKSEDYFDVARYPKITLKSISFKHKSGDNYVGQFNLTIKNKTKAIEIPFTCTQKDNTTAFKGTFKINRLDYGVGSSSMILSDEVTILIDAEAGR